MSLSPGEQQLLDGIETGLRTQDPTFPAKLTFGTAKRYRRRQTGLTHGWLWLGMIMTLTGFGLVHEKTAAGVMLILSLDPPRRCKLILKSGS
jgi:hypothetical protein